MRGSTHAVAAAFLILSITACGAGEPQTDEVRENTQPGGMIVASASAEARQYFADGLREWDYNRAPEALANFVQATALDPNFALAYVYAWATAQNAVEGRKMLAQAVELASTASEYERLVITAVDRREKADMQGALQSLEMLTQKYPDNARAWEFVAWIRTQAGETQPSRQAYQKAIELDAAHPSYYMYLAESLTGEQPTDFARAETLLLKAIELEPNESYIHDLLGDVYRQQGKLEQSAAAYTRAAELDPTSGGPLQQRGHVNTFMGRYAEARADYDAGVAVAKGNFKPGYALYRGFVHLFEGNPRGAVDEIEALYKSIDGMDIPDPDGVRQLILNDLGLIAQHHRMLDVMDRVTQQRAEIRERMIAAVNTDDFRTNEAKQKELEDGFMAAYRGNYTAADAHAEAYRKLRDHETAANKLWPYHNLKGTIALLQGRHDEALQHLRQSNPNNIYLTYLSAQAHERLGHKPEAKALYEQIAKHNFNPVALALTRREAEAKVKAL